jgi:hypothetical protein
MDAEGSATKEQLPSGDPALKFYLIFSINIKLRKAKAGSPLREDDGK